MNTLKKGSSEWKDAFASIRKSLDGLTVDEALEKLQKLKVNPELQEGLLKSAKRADILKGTTEEIEEGIKKVGQSSSYIDDLALGFKGLWATLATNPLTWIEVGIAGFSALIKGVDALIGKQEKLARTKLEDLDEDISTYDEEIQSLETLQIKLESAKGNKSELAKIQNELNDAIGETTGLLNGEGKAYDIANAKLKANIELKKQQRAQATKEKISASKDLFDGNVYEVDWDFDVTGDQMRTVTKEYQKYLKEYETLSKKDKEFWKKLDIKSAEDYAFKAIKDKGIDLGGGTTRVFSFDKSDWTDYWNEQVKTAYDVFDEVIQDYDGVGGQDFIKNLIDNMVRNGSDLSEIGTIITQVTENPKLQEAINSYWESLVNPEIDSEEALKSVKSMIDGIIKQYPQLESFFNDFYEGIVSGANVVADTVTDTANKIDDSRTKMISSINDMSEGFESLDKIYSSIKDDDPFDFKLLDDKAFKETFSTLDGYADFIEQITSNSDDIDACQLAFNNLVTEWIRSTGVLNNLTDENANLTVSMLKQMGVANAEEIVLSSLNAQKEASIEVGKDFANITEEDIDALIAEGKVSATTCQYLSQLRLAKLDVNKLQLDTRSDVNNILAIANASGASIAQIVMLEAALKNLQSTKTSSLNALKKGVSIYNSSLQNQEALKQNKVSFEDQLKQAQKEVQGVLNSIQNSAKLNASDFYADYTGGSKSNGDSGGSQSEKEFNWIETLLSRIQNKISDLGKTASATWKSWTERNSALKDQMSAVSQEISLQQQAISKYESLAGSLGLSSYYQNLVKNGALDISTITDDNIADKISKYQEYWEKIVSAEDAIQDLEDELRNLARTEFDNVAKQFDDRLSVIEHETNLLNGTIDILENKGYLASAKLYDSLIQNEQERLSELQAKYTSLNSAISGISQGTEQWYEMYAEVLSVKEEIQDATNAMIEFNNSIRDLEWEVFDILQERMSTVISEAEFFIELMSDEKMFDDNGITEHGQATLGLHAVNYNVYMQQADEYKKALEELDEVYANDSLNQDYLERRDELLEQHRDMILSAESEKEALKDLMSQGYDSLLESMQKIIDKRKEMMNQMKDLYDYEKSISEQTKEIANLEKQLHAYQGDNSEESRATIQQIKVSLEKAKENLQETEYDKYISDQQQMLDLLQEETEMWINERLDNEDLLLQNIIDSINGDSGSIKATLQAEANKVGTTLSDKMESIFSPNGTFTSVVSTYSGQFTNKLTTVNDTLTQIKSLVDHMVKDADAEAAKQQAQSSTPATSTPSTSGSGSSSSSSSSGGSSSSSKSGWEQYLIYKADSYPKSKLSINSSIVDRLKYNNFDSSFNTRAKLYSAMGGSGSYVGSSSQNVFMLNKMKSAGYKVGSSYIPYNQSNWIHEDELVYRASDGGLLMPLGSGDKVFTKEMSDKLWNMAKMDFRPVLPIYDLSNLNTRGNGDSSIGDITFDIKMYGVNDIHEMAEQVKTVYQNNVGNLRKTIKADIYGGMMGKNSLNRYKY